MAITCINRNLPEYTELNRLSGHSDSLLSIQVYNHMLNSKTGLMPTIEKIAFDTSQSLAQEYNTDFKGNSLFIDNTEISKLNLQHRDLIIEPTSPLSNRWVSVKHKSTILSDNKSSEDILLNNKKFLLPKNKTLIIDSFTSNLEKRLGVEIESLPIEEFNSETGKVNAVGAIKEGRILLNSQLATDTTKVHELLHLLIGPMKITHPKLFEVLSKTVENIPEVSYMYDSYYKYTQLDIMEELIVETMARYLNNELSEESMEILEDKGMKEFLYELGYILDTGLDTSKSLTKEELTLELTKPLRDIFLSHNDTWLEQLTSYGELSRNLSNIKSNLMQENLLEENCI